MSDIETRTYDITGMTCEHCVRSVEEEVSQVAGVQAAEAKLSAGRLTVAGTSFDDDAIRAAVAEAGYEVAPS